MFDQSSKTRVRRLLLTLSSLVGLLAGCDTYYPFLARPIRPCKTCAECIPGSGFQTTVWQTWQDGRMSLRAECTEVSPNAAWLDGVTSPVPGMEPKPQAETVPAPAAEERRLPGIPPSENVMPNVGPPSASGEGTASPPSQIQKPPPPPGAIPPAKKPEKLEEKPAMPPRDPGTITDLPVHNPVIELVVAPSQTGAVRGSEAAFLPPKEPGEGEEAMVARWLIPSEPGQNPDGIVTQVARWDVPQLRIGPPGVAEKSAGPIGNGLPPATLSAAPPSTVQSADVPAGGFPTGFFSHSPEVPAAHAAALK
jgi:hypothetical protein